MGNCSQYELRFPERRPLQTADVDAALAVAAARGFVPHFPTDVTTGWPPSISVKSRSELLEQLGRRGGVADLNSPDQHMILSTSIEERRLSVGVLYQLRPERDEKMADELEAIFIGLCERLSPQFGQVSDEWGWEGLLWSPGFAFTAAYAKYLRDLDSGLPPPFLFWLTFFGPEYCARLGSEAFESLRGKRERKCGNGILIYLGDRPWDGDTAVFRDGCYYRG